jgi:hypothetical protein
VLTEGLLIYLDPHDVDGLSEALNRLEVALWMFDFFSLALVRRLTKKSASMLESAPFKFARGDGVEYFEKLGWTTLDAESRCWLQSDFSACRGSSRIYRSPTRESWTAFRGMP